MSGAGVVSTVLASTALVSKAPSLAKLGSRFAPPLLREVSTRLKKLEKNHKFYDAAMVYSSGKDFERRTSCKAAVMLPFCHVHGKASILLMVRATSVGSHKGHVSFPGGHCEEGETPEETAIRELHEEVGGVGHINVLGSYHDVQAVTGTWVTPIIGFISKDVGDLSILRPNPNEVQGLFTLHIEDLLAVEDRASRLKRRVSCSQGNNYLGSFFCEAAEQLNKNVADHDRFYAHHHQVGHILRSRGTVPIFRDGPKPVWGLTAFILDQVLNQVIAPSVETVAAQEQESKQKTATGS